jgi:dephospho-CoA kinase
MFSEPSIIKIVDLTIQIVRFIILKMNKKPIIGILGGIGSGKSTVANQFVKSGCAVIDADKIAHEILDNSDIVNSISKVFGADVLSADGTIDRAKLAEKAFENAEQMEKLNSIVHPPVLERCEQLLAQFMKDASVPAVVLDVPLLLETGWDRRCDVLIFVESPWAVRLKRIADKTRHSEEQIKKRENFQISLDKKRHLAQYTVKNNSDLADLAEQVARVYTAVMNK